MAKTLKRITLGLLALIIIAAIGAYLKARSAGNAQFDGNMKLAGLSAPVQVLRDELGIPYIFATNTPDLIKAQGFVTAQHRLLQMELFRATWRGELAATFGPDALPSDIRMRVLGISRNGQRHAPKLDTASRAFFQNYVDGVNGYITAHTADHPLELKLAGISPKRHYSLTLNADPLMRMRLILVPTVMSFLLILALGVTTYLARRH